MKSVMIKSRSVVFLSLLALVVYGVANGQKIKIGFVNKGEILQQSVEFKRAQEKFNKQKEKWDRQLEQMRKELDDKLANYQKQQGTMSEEALKKVQSELEALNQKINLYYNEIYVPPNGKLQQLENELAEPIRIKLENIINKIGQEEGFHMIVDTGPGSDIIYTGGLINLNSRVIAELNKTATGDTAKTSKSKKKGGK